MKKSRIIIAIFVLVFVVGILYSALPTLIALSSSALYITFPALVILGLLFYGIARLIK